MALSTTAALGLSAALAAAGAGLQYQNTQSTAKKQDRALAESLRSKAGIQRKADEKVAQEVEKLKGSRSDDERRKALDSYSEQLRRNKGKVEGGLTPNYGSDAFREGAAATAAGVQQYGDETAGLMSRIDAPTMQRQGEAFGYGNLATDLNLIAREGSGQAFLDELRLRAIRRSAGKDALASFLGGAAGGVTGMGGGSGASAASAGNALYGAGFRGLGSVGY